MPQEHYPYVRESETDIWDKLGITPDLVEEMGGKPVYPNPTKDTWYQTPFVYRDRKTGEKVTGYTFSVQGTETDFVRTIEEDPQKSGTPITVVILEGNGIFHSHMSDGSTQHEEISDKSTIVYDTTMFVAYEATGNEPLVGVRLSGLREETVPPTSGSI